eukprot:scaffold10803_cov133-Isochrysis_galbana.AAC.2
MYIIEVEARELAAPPGAPGGALAVALARRAADSACDVLLSVSACELVRVLSCDPARRPPGGRARRAARRRACGRAPARGVRKPACAARQRDERERCRARSRGASISLSAKPEAARVRAGGLRTARARLTLELVRRLRRRGPEDSRPARDSSKRRSRGCDRPKLRALARTTGALGWHYMARTDW